MQRYSAERLRVSLKKAAQLSKNLSLLKLNFSNANFLPKTSGNLAKFTFFVGLLHTVLSISTHI